MKKQKETIEIIIEKYIKSNESYIDYAIEDFNNKINALSKSIINQVIKNSDFKKEEVTKIVKRNIIKKIIDTI